MISEANNTIEPTKVVWAKPNQPESESESELESKSELESDSEFEYLTT